MRSKILIAALAVAGSIGPAYPQNRIDPQSTMHITLPEDSPVTLQSAGWGDSTATPRGGAMLLELHTSLSFRNSGQRKVRGITLLVTAQDVTPGGKASVSVPSLNVAPGESFPVRVDLRLLRPLTSGNGPLAEVSLDGVLFDDWSFYGPNKLNSRRSMMVWELEARRDRQHFKKLLERNGEDALKNEMLASLSRQADRASSHARVAQAPRATNFAGERQVQFAFLDMPGAPIEAQGGMARIASNELRSPRVFVQNRTGRGIRDVELGWLVKDGQGREYVAGSAPVEVRLAPMGRANIVQDVTFKLTRPDGKPLDVEDVRAYVSSVEFDDGGVWVPQRGSEMATPSPEEQRLAELYRKRGLEALVTELNKF